MAAYARPENALKQAEGLIAVGQKDQALNTLHDVITSKRHRTWSKVLEDIMKKYVQLCVELRKGKFAKEGLHQYKLVCQVNFNSLEIVIKHYLQLAEASAKEAQSKAKQTILDIEDLEAEESAESIILTAVSGEDRSDRTDREIVTPWLRFLWETYRTVLETLRNSAKLESLYHETAQLAFNFCLRYQRKNEFRRLSDILRNHLTNLGKYPNQPQSINLNNPETLKVHLVTRFTQLNVATELELWQEAFRSVEDIHGLMTMAHKPLTPEMTATYFQRLARIFWVSNNHLFHAYAWFKYFAIARANLKDREEYTTMASSVLLAALSIPLSDPKLADEQYFEYDLQKEKNLRMGTLLGFAVTPKREFLLQDLVSKNIHKTVFPELQDIYEVLEKRFNPLQLCQKMSEKFAFIKTKPELAQYEEQLQKLTFLRLIQQLSQVYESMKITDFKNMVSFMDSHTIEKLLVNAVKRRFAGVRIDHQNGAIHFGGSGREAEQLRDQLTQLAKGLQQANKMITPKPQDNEVYVKDKREAFVRIVDSLKDMFAYFQTRRNIIEKRKFEAEAKAAEAQRKQQNEEAAKKKKRELELQKKAEREEQILAKKREKALKDQKATEEAINILKPFISDPEVAATIANPKTYIASQVENEKRKIIAKEEALRTLATDLTHKERALRENERALLVVQNETKKVEAREKTIQLQQAYLISHREQHVADLAEKQRLSRMSSARAKFEERVMSARRADYEKLKADQEARLAEIKAEREAEKQRLAAEEEEKRNRMAEERRIAEERERERRRIEDEKRAEEDAARKKLAEQAELQRKREAEAIQRRAEEEKTKEAQRAAEEEKRAAERKPDSATWGRREEAPRDDRWGARRDERPRDDRWGRDAPRDDRRDAPRDDRWGRDAPRDDRRDAPRDDRWGRDAPRDDRRDAPRDDRWGRRDEAPRDVDRRDAPRDDRWGRRDEAPRDDRWGRRDEAPRDDRWGRRDEAPRDDRWGRRDEAPRDRDAPRERDAPRDERPRDDRVRDERPRDDRRDDRRWGGRDEERASTWRKDDSERRQEDKPARDARDNREAREPREEKPAAREPERAPVREEKEEKKDDGFSVVAKRRGGRK